MIEVKESSEAFMMCKQHRKVFTQESKNKAKAPLELVHANMCDRICQCISFVIWIKPFVNLNND